MSIHIKTISLLGLLWVAMCCATTASGQTIHLINVADTSDPKIGRSCEEDMGNVAQIFFFGFPERMLHETRLSGEQVTVENITAAIEQTAVRSNDAMVFFWSGHGGYDVEKKEHFFKMPQGGLLYRPTLLGALQKKSARLTVLLTDSCATSSTRRPVCNRWPPRRRILTAAWPHCSMSCFSRLGAWSTSMRRRPASLP